MDLIVSYSKEPVHYFKERNIIPPEFHDQGHGGEFTLGELDCKIVNINSPSDQNIGIFTQSGGTLYPHIMIPYKAPKERRYKNVEITSKSTYADNIRQWLREKIQLEDGLMKKYIINPLFSLFNIHNDDRNIPETLKIDSNNPVRCFSWHKHKQKFAIALQDNTVRIYNVVTQKWSNLCLEHEFQKDINCLEWKPNNGSTLAVGCKDGICLWNILSKRVQVGSGTTTMVDEHAWMNFLKYPKFGPVNTLSWCPSGRYLAAGSINYNGVIVWDVDIENPTALAEYCLGGVTKLMYSPNGKYLFASTTGNVFRVWDTETWANEKWKTNSSYCQASAWSSDGNLLAFSEARDSKIYIVRFTGYDHKLEGVLVKVLDFSSYTVNLASKRQIQVGGNIENLAWDPTSKRLVVSFEESELIANLQCNAMGQSVDFYPIGFMRGPHKGTSCPILHFIPEFPKGALLASCWRSGKISLTPLYFVKDVITK